MRLLNAALADPSIKLLSVDIFDTLLLRDTRPELARFGMFARAQDTELRRAGRFSPGAEALYRARLSVHKRAYDAVRAAGRGEVVHEGLLAEICRRTGMDETMIPVLVAAELACELKMLRPNRSLLHRLAHAGRPLVLASDMYLSAMALRKLLAELAPGLERHRLYLSSECGLTKRRGDLFPYLIAREAIPAAAILHIGDHPIADCERPQAAGLRAAHVPRGYLWQQLHGWRDRLVRFRLNQAGWLVTGPGT